ncbi:hypothetical protein PG990_004644 [Apiospora arundinis]
MSKRSWEQANQESSGMEADGLDHSPGSLFGAAQQSPPPRNDHEYATTTRPTERNSTSDGGTNHIPMISRKIKACASCRKHKIKCVMDQNQKRCRRCIEKNLGCVLNKSLQTLISERSQTNEAMVQDLEMLHSGLQRVLKTMNLSSLGPLHSTRQMIQTPAAEEPHEIGPSCDNSPRLSPADINDLPKVPIQSVYHLTKLSALRSPDDADASHMNQQDLVIDDFISKGQLSLGDAERLFNLYMSHLDHFMYGIGGRHKTLDGLRRSSRILAACIFTVAALHDPQSNVIYGVCSKEFRRLVASSMFQRQIDRDYLRALSIGAYWLSDISWILSGHAIRRASEFNISGLYRRVVSEGNSDALDYIRIWYILYISDQHLSTLFGRSPVIRDDYTVQGWEEFIECSATNEEDNRLASQVSLLNILHSIRELFGPDNGEPISKVYVMQISSFSRQLDQWLARWSSAIIQHHERIGGFPRKGVHLHYHYAKLILYSHVFRGIHDSSIPAHFLDSAASAVAAATNTVNVLISDPEMQPALVGLPSYMHSMTGYACMFLAKLATVHGDQLIEKPLVIDLTSRLAALYRSTPVGKFHLMNLMADGLDKVIVALQNNIATNDQADHGPLDANTHLFPPTAAGDSMFSDMDPSFVMDYNVTMGASHLMYLGGGPSVFDTTDLSPTFF